MVNGDCWYHHIGAEGALGAHPMGMGDSGALALRRQYSRDNLLLASSSDDLMNRGLPSHNWSDITNSARGGYSGHALAPGCPEAGRIVWLFLAVLVRLRC